MRIQPFTLLSIVCLLATAACRSSEDNTEDMSAPPDLSTPTGIDLARPIDFAEPIDLPKPVDLANVDMYTPLFGPAASYAVETGPLYLTSADLNRDGVRDLIVVNTNLPEGPNYDGVPPLTPSTFSILLGNGDGTFQPKTSRNIGQYPFAIAVADLNGDLNVDLVITKQGGYEIYLGNGNGTFGSVMSHTVATYTRAVAVGDLDGDGKLDLALSDLGDVTGKVWVARGDGSGGFDPATPHEVSTVTTMNQERAPVALRLADMNGDNKLDVVTSNVTNTATINSISILTNGSVSGSGVIILSTPFEIMAGKRPQDLLVGDLDGGNKRDIVVANADENGVSVYLSDAGGATLSFASPVPYSVGMAPTSLAFGDIDADGKLDVLTADNNGNTVTVLYGAANGKFDQATATRPGSERYGVGSGPRSVIAATFNADAKLDVATVNQLSNDVSVLINQR